MLHIQILDIINDGESAVIRISPTPDKFEKTTQHEKLFPFGKCEQCGNKIGIYERHIIEFLDFFRPLKDHIRTEFEIEFDKDFLKLDKQILDKIKKRW